MKPHLNCGQDLALVRASWTVEKKLNTDMCVSIHCSLVLFANNCCKLLAETSLK